MLAMRPWRSQRCPCCFARPASSTVLARTGCIVRQKHTLNRAEPRKDISAATAAVATDAPASSDSKFSTCSTLSPNSNLNRDPNSNPIPSTPTWSVHALLSSYPRPSLSPATLRRLHDLAALVSPQEGTPAHARAMRDMEEMVRLVEAVRLVDVRALEESLGVTTGAASASTAPGAHTDSNADSKVTTTTTTTVPDGRIWPENTGMLLSSNARAVEFDDPEIESGQALLKYATRTKGEYYVVEAGDRRRGAKKG